MQDQLKELVRKVSSRKAQLMRLVIWSVCLGYVYFIFGYPTA